MKIGVVDETIAKMDEEEADGEYSVKDEGVRVGSAPMNECTTLTTLRFCA